MCVCVRVCVEGGVCVIRHFVHTSKGTIWGATSLAGSSLKRQFGRSSVNLNRNIVTTIMPKSTHRVTFLLRYGRRILTQGVPANCYLIS